MFRTFKIFWKWLWNSNSILSWVVNFLIAFVLVRFIFYPVLGLLLGTTLPLVVIESGSMEHFGNYDDWWKAQEDFYEDFELEKEDVQDWPFKNGFNKGDIAMIKKREFSELKIGDVLVFRPSDQEKAIIHRIVEISEDSVSTKGDANVGQIGSERIIKPEQLEGIAVLRVPGLGWVKLFLTGNVG